MLGTFLSLTGRPKIAAAIKLVDVRNRIAEVLKEIDLPIT